MNPAKSQSSPRFRVRGPLQSTAVTGAPVGTRYVRTSFDQRSRATLEVQDETLHVWHEAFGKSAWQWRETPRVRREFPRHEPDAAVAYFNSLALSPGYLGPIALDEEFS